MKSFFAKLQVLAFLAILFGNGLYAQIPNGYYNNATGKTSDELKEALHGIIQGHTSITYSNIWNAFWSTDNKGNGVVWDMYSDIPNGTPPYTYSMGQNQCGEYVQEGDCYNREHSWPQSWFSGDDQAIPSRDLHHVFPTDGFVNAQRSNYPFGEVNTASWISQNGSKLGTCKSSLGYSGTVFEPIDEYKGDFARAMMYMSVRYYGEDENWGTSDMTNKSEILPWAINMLMDWSDNDPVSQKEIDRNNVIYSDYQHNRNPFIDHPEYARMIWDPNWHGGMGGYVKVTSSNEITDGDYLIVCENSNVAFNGALTSLDGGGNKIDVTISGNIIESNAETDAAAFTITAKTGGYSIKSASGLYIGNTSDANALKTSTSDTYVNTISIADGDAAIVCSSSHLRYNAANNQTRFRYFKSGTYTSQQAIQLYKKIETYSINLASVENGSISANTETAVEGTAITLTATPDAGYEFDYWMVTAVDGSFVAVADNQFVMPASNVTVSAVFVVAFSQQYYLVTDANQLIAGRTYLIVNTEYAKALGTTQNTNNRSAADVTISSNIISDLGDACELVLGGQSGAWTFFDANWGNNGGYLYAAGGSNNNNYLKTQATLTNAGKWTISINGNKATIKTIDSNVNRHTIMYNNSSNMFSCYASGQKDVCLFIRREQYEHTENESIAQLFSFDKHVVRSGVTLTVADEANCSDPNHFILEDGAQFIHNAGSVNATMRKNIVGYVDDGGWYTLAFPMSSTNLAQTNMLTADYDLYAYAEAAELEWVNQKAYQDDFAFNSGSGYLYAHNPGFVLCMSGTLNSGNYTESVNLSYGNSHANIRGFNLLGNPTAHEIGFTKSSNVSDGYYYIDNGDAWTYTTSTTVPVGRGFLVKANAPGQTVTLNSQSRGENVDNSEYVCLGIGEYKTYIKLNEGVSMPLIDLMGEHSPFYLLRDQQPYIMLVRNGLASLDLCYEVSRAGQQTLVAQTEGLGLDYLHLIDRLTGADIDLLATPEYTFEARPTDYAARFALLFSEVGADTDAPFAHYSDGRIVVTYNGEATLQVIDLLGRMVDAKHLVPGVYLLRLITPDAVRVQRLVVD